MIPGKENRQNSSNYDYTIILLEFYSFHILPLYSSVRYFGSLMQRVIRSSVLGLCEVEAMPLKSIQFVCWVVLG
jgi:hypothetical protein